MAVDPQLLPPTSLFNAVKKGGEVLDSWLSHQIMLALPRQYQPPPDTRVPWNKSFVGMEDNNGPSFARIYYIATPKKVIGIEVHTRSTDEVIHVPKAALKYNITNHVLMMSTPRKVYPPDVNEPWRLKKNKHYKIPPRLEQISVPRKSYPSTDRPPSEIGHPPRAAIYGSPPSRRPASSQPRPARPPTERKASAPVAPTSTAEPTTSNIGPTTSSTGPTTSSTGPTTSSTGPTTSTTGPTTSTTGPTTSTTGMTGTSSSTGVTSSSSGSSNEAPSSSDEESGAQVSTGASSDAPTEVPVAG